jgi:hypothetical protein
MPEPIIEPATSIVESSRPSPLTNLPSLVVGGCDMTLLSEPFGFRGELTTAQPGGAMPNAACSGFEAKTKEWLHAKFSSYLFGCIRAISNCCRRSPRRARHRGCRIGRRLSRPGRDSDGIQKLWASEKPCYPPAPCLRRIASHLREEHCRSSSQAWRLPPNCSAPARRLQYRHSCRRNLRRCLWCVHDKIICSCALTSMASRPGCAWTPGPRSARSPWIVAAISGSLAFPAARNFHPVFRSMAGSVMLP